MVKLSRSLRKISSAVPLWPAHLHAPPSLKNLSSPGPFNTPSPGAAIVYFPACITRMMGSYQGKEKSGMDTFFSICNKANIQVVCATAVNTVCCSQMFSSKGFAQAHALAAKKVTDILWLLSAEGKLPVVTDVSSCAYSLQHLDKVLDTESLGKWNQLIFMDTVEFISHMAIPRLTVKTKKDRIVLHPVCSLQRMHTEHQFSSIARHFAAEVITPKAAGCCGMAGDRGFFFPELTASATEAEANEVRQHACNALYSTTKTCELAMSEAVGRQYVSLLYLVDEAT